MFECFVRRLVGLLPENRVKLHRKRMIVNQIFGAFVIAFTPMEVKLLEHVSVVQGSSVHHREVRRIRFGAPDHHCVSIVRHIGLVRVLDVFELQRRVASGSNILILNVNGRLVFPQASLVAVAPVLRTVFPVVAEVVAVRVAAQEKRSENEDQKCHG